MTSLRRDSYEVRVIGTEEIWLPISLHRKLVPAVRSTTRSPIAISTGDNYHQNAIHLPPSVMIANDHIPYNVTEEVDRQHRHHEEMTKAFEDSIKEQLQPY